MPSPKLQSKKFQDSDSDGEVPVKPTPKVKASPKSSPKLAPKRAPSTEVVEKTEKKKTATKRSSEGEPVEETAAKKGARTEAEPAAPATSGIVGRLLSEFNLNPNTVKALQKINITTLFPVQSLTLDHLMDGKDVLVQSRTGSGKTLAFAIPIVERLYQAKIEKVRGRGPFAVVFCPTRELAIQVRDVIESIAPGFVVTSLYGGVAYATQERTLFSGVDVVVGTPGRVKDMLEKGTLKFNRVKMAVLDEADHMLDIGFKDDIELLLRKVADQNGSTPDQPNHQTILFSATVPEWVHTSSFISKNKEFIDMVGKDTVRTASTIRFFRRKCNSSEIPSMLADLVRVYSGKHGRTLVFTNTKKDCHDLAINNTRLDAQSLHGDMQQEQRESTMKSFRDNKFSVLIATDVAARGLDIPMVDLVIQCAPPSDIDSFIHRAGRTGRAGRKGVCLLLHTMRDEYIVDKIEKYAKMKFEMLPSPSRDDILKAVARDVTEDLARVERRATDLFREQASEILKEADPVEILASALAVMSGYTSNITRRGLVTGIENHTTFRITPTSDRSLPIPVYCGILRNNLGDDLFARCKDLSLLQDENGCVFDCPDTFANKILEQSDQIRGMTLEVIETLPAILPRESRGGNAGSFGRGGGNFGRGGGNFGRGGGNFGRGGGNFGRGGGNFGRGRRY